MPCKFGKTDFPGVIVVDPVVFNDERGFFYESYKASEFIKNGIEPVFVQDNHSLSKKGVIRGLHFQQNPRAQGKLVRVIRGSVLDVVVDIRVSSKFFKKWIAVELTDENKKMLYIPPGFAHGFQALTDNTHFAYKCTEEYSPQHDTGIRWDDPDINILWPIQNPVVSAKDASLPFLRDATIL